MAHTSLFMNVTYATVYVLFFGMATSTQGLGAVGDSTDETSSKNSFVFIFIVFR